MLLDIVECRKSLRFLYDCRGTAYEKERTPMRAFTLVDFGAEPSLRDDIPEPSPGDNELLVRVHASSVNPVDVFIAAGGLKEMAEHEFPVTLGRDFAGVVEQVGSRVSRYQVGDEVFGFVLHANPTVRDGSWAELIALPEDHVAVKPRRVDFAHAGAAPLVGITAITAFDALGLAEDETVLVVGATGGVGSLFVQLAFARGVSVIAPALPEDRDYLRGLGVSEVVERNGNVADAVRQAHPDGVAAILDVVSPAPDTSLLREGGRLASPLGAAGEGAGRFNLMAQPTPANLQRLAELLDSGTLRVPIQRTYDLEQAGEALQAFSTTHTVGKLGLTIA
jgi:NADPH2:quinone reductase